MSDTDSGATAPPIAKATTALVLVPKPDGKAPAHASDPRQSEAARSSFVAVNREELFDMLDQLKKLSPCHRDPHRFHERKDELVGRFYNMATAL